MVTTVHLRDGNSVQVAEDPDAIRLKLSKDVERFVQFARQRGPVWIAASAVTHFEEKRSGKMVAA